MKMKNSMKLLALAIAALWSGPSFAQWTNPVMAGPSYGYTAVVTTDGGATYTGLDKAADFTAAGAIDTAGATCSAAGATCSWVPSSTLTATNYTASAAPALSAAVYTLANPVTGSSSTYRASGVTASNGSKSTELTYSGLTVKDGANQTTVSASGLTTTGTVSAAAVVENGVDLGVQGADNSAAIKMINGTLASQQGQINALGGRLDKVSAGVSNAVAYQQPFVDVNHKFGFTGGWGNFDNYNSFAGMATIRFSPNWTASVGAATSTTGVYSFKAGIGAQF